MPAEEQVPLPDAPVTGAGVPTAEQPPVVARSLHGRAGRNLPAAIAVGVLLATLVIGTVLLAPVAFVVVALAAVAVGTRELVGALRAGGAAPPLLPVLGAGLACTAAAWVYGPQALALAALLSVLALAALLSVTSSQVRRDLPAAVLAVAYVGVLVGFAVLLLRPDDGAARVLLFITATTFSDIGGYAAGVLTGGRHKMSPVISPGKSWEGFTGSLAAAGAVGAIWVPLGLDGGTWWAGLLFGFVVAATATAGDLGMSALKRDVGVKDMGTVLPGHGGLMDRLDSLVVVAPVAWVGLSLITPVG